MIKITNSLSAVTLAAGLVLGTAGVALANTSQTGTAQHAVMSTPITKLNASQLEGFKGQEIYDLDGGKIGTIKRLVRDQKTNQMYFVIDGDYLMGDPGDRAAIPVNRLHRYGNEIVLLQKHPELPALQGLGALPIRHFFYTGKDWSPTSA